MKTTIFLLLVVGCSKPGVRTDSVSSPVPSVSSPVPSVTAPQDVRTQHDGSVLTEFTAALAKSTRFAVFSASAGGTMSLRARLDDPVQVQRIRDAIGSGPIGDAARRCPDTARLVGLDGDSQVLAIGWCNDLDPNSAQATVGLSGQTGVLALRDPTTLTALMRSALQSK